MNRNQIYRITENVIKRLVNEGLLTDDEYNEDAEDFDINLEEDLINFCKNNDFIYIINGRKGVASFSEAKSEIINDIRTSPFLKVVDEYEKDGSLVKVIELKDYNDGFVYQILYEQ